nr:hypothetical protein Itr_chr11CG18970 [Ipomoea trifida]
MGAQPGLILTTLSREVGAWPGKNQGESRIMEARWKSPKPSTWLNPRPPRLSPTLGQGLRLGLKAAKVEPRARPWPSP